MRIQRAVNAKLRDLIQQAKQEKTKDKELKTEENLNNNNKRKIRKPKISIKTARYIEKRIEHKEADINEFYIQDFEELDQQLEDGEIDKEEYDKKVDRLDYKYKKSQYKLNNTDEKPKNPRIERLKNTMIKGAKSVGKFFGNIGKGIAIGAGVIAMGAVAVGKGAWGLVKKVPRLPVAVAKTATKATLRSARTIGTGMHYVGKKVNRVKENVKQNVANVKEEMLQKDWENAIRENKQRDEAILQEDWKAAIEENKQRDEATLEEDWEEAIEENKIRDALGMKHIDINHEKAIQGAEGNLGQENEREESQEIN